MSLFCGRSYKNLSNETLIALNKIYRDHKPYTKVPAPLTAEQWHDYLLDLQGNLNASTDAFINANIKLVEGKRTWFNQLGRMFAYGTDCKCCLGYRILFAFIAGLLLTYWR